MANPLARIHGTEKDKVNCAFFSNFGACHYGNKCHHWHNKPASSPTILMKHLYRHPMATESTVAAAKNPESITEDYLVFYEDLYLELSKFGRLEGLFVVDNVGDHIIGHIYAKFSKEEEAADALKNVQGEYYDGIMLDCEYSPVTDFHQARCGEYDEGRCSSANVCNFLHVEPVPAALIRSLDDDAEAQRRSSMTVCTVQLGTPRSA